MSLFHEGGRGPEKTTLSLLKNVNISLGGVRVKANLDNVTKYDVFLAAKAQLNTCTYVLSFCLSVRLWIKLNFFLFGPLSLLSSAYDS